MQSHISIPVDGEIVTGELFIPDTKIIASMLFCHGWTSKNIKYLPYAQELSMRGVMTVAINLRGHGDSIYSLENYSRQDHFNDVLASIDYVTQLHSQVPFILFGKSYGGYLSSLACSSNAALIQKDPNIFRSREEKLDTNKALKSISQFRNPLLIIESENDEEVLDVPKQYIKASENNKKRSTFIIPDTDHPLSRPEWRLDYFLKITDWLQKHKII